MLEVFAVKTALLSCAAARAYHSASTTIGQRTSWTADGTPSVQETDSRERSGWLAIRPVLPKPTRSKTYAARHVI